MSVRNAIDDRLRAAPDRDLDGPRVCLPLSLKKDKATVRTALFKRLAASRHFALGDRAGVLRAAQNRSGRAFRLDVRQKVIVKALVSRHLGQGAERAAALRKHVLYLGRAGAGRDGDRPEFFDGRSDGLAPAAETADWSDDRHHFRFIISPEHGERLELKAYVREVMARVAADLGEPDLTWAATCHYDTDQPHAHVLVRGRRGDGRDLVIPRDYIGYGFRARAQEVAQERLGDLSRVEAERRIWRETEADRFTGFDRRLVSAADPDRTVPDGMGGADAWAALTRGRLRHLERLGLATRRGRRYELAPDLEVRLRTLQIRRDVIRTLNQRRIEGARDVRPLGLEPVRGEVARAGFHDEMGASPFVVIRDKAGVEHYARLAIGSVSPRPGFTITLQPLSNGTAQILSGRGAELAR